MEYSHNLRKYINAYPDFVKFLNKENDKLDDIQYSKLFFNTVNRLNWYDECIFDILKMNVFKPKFERLFIIGLLSGDRWSNMSVRSAIQATKEGYINSKYYDDIMTTLLARNDFISSALLYNVEGFKKYNDIIEMKCMSTTNGSPLIDIIQDKQIDIAIKYIALNKIIEKHEGYIENSIDAICTLDEDQREAMMNHYMHKLVNKKTINHFCAMVSEYNIKLNNNVAKKIHNDCGIGFFNENVRRFETIRRYCFTFGNCLSEEEKTTIFKRLQTKTRRSYINEAIERINFTEDQKNKLQSYVLLYELAV